MITGKKESFEKDFGTCLQVKGEIGNWSRKGVFRRGESRWVMSHSESALCRS